MFLQKRAQDQTLFLPKNLPKLLVETLFSRTLIRKAGWHACQPPPAPCMCAQCWRSGIVFVAACLCVCVCSSCFVNKRLRAGLVSSPTNDVTTLQQQQLSKTRPPHYDNAKGRPGAFVQTIRVNQPSQTALFVEGSLLGK